MTTAVLWGTTTMECSVVGSEAMEGTKVAEVVVTNQEVDLVEVDLVVLVASEVAIRVAMATVAAMVDTVADRASPPEAVVHLKGIATLPSLSATSEMLINVVLRTSSETST